MSLNPWEPGFVAPPALTEEEIKEKHRERGRNGSAARIRNDQLQAEGKPREYIPFEKSKRKKPPEMLMPGGRHANPESAHSQKLASYTEDALTIKQKFRVERFVQAYLASFDPVTAALNMMAEEAGGVENVNSSTALVTGYNMIRWPAVQDRIKAVLAVMDEENLLNRKTVLMGLLKEAHHAGGDTSHGARVRAWMGLARILKMDVQVTENHHKHSGGVMLIPGTPTGEVIDVDAWEVAAEQQQSHLKAVVRD